MNTDRNRTPTRGLLVLGVCGVALLTVLLIGRSHFSKPPTSLETAEPVVGEAMEPSGQAPATAQTEIPRKWGIEPTGLRLAVGGNVLDFRYRVLDPVKASVLLRQQDDEAYLVNQADGKRVPLANGARSGSFHRDPKELQAGYSYFMYFPNPGKQFQAGSKVTLVMGNFRAENLTVQ